MPTLTLLLAEIKAHHPRPLGLLFTLVLFLCLVLAFPGSVVA
jgi:hypothetical protein